MKKYPASVHEGKKPFEICDYSSAQKSDKSKHVESVHEGKKLFNCDAFHYSCFQRSHINRHVVSVHEGKKPNQS